MIKATFRNSFITCAALLLSQTLQAAPLQNPYTTINLNPGGSYSGEGEHAMSWQGVWGRQGFDVYSETLGYTTLGNAQAYAYVQSTQVAGGGGNARVTTAESQLSYLVSVDANDPQYAGLQELYMFVDLQASRTGDGIVSSTNSTGAISSLQIENLNTGEFMVDYNTNNDTRFEDISYDDGERLRTLEYMEAFAVGTTFEVRLSAFASVRVPNNTVDPQVYTSSSWIDPYFYFDQAAYDSARALDPTLPDIILADEFTISASPGIYVQPVPVPAAVWLFASGLIGLLGVARRNKR